MKYIRGTTQIQILESTIISLGKFDGLHMGHKLLLETMLERKKQQGLSAVMFTFDIPPKKMVQRADVEVLTTNHEKEEIFARTGIDYLIEYPFTDEVRQMQPEEFIQMLVEKLNVKCIVAGTDFCFGYNRSGNHETLREFSAKLGYEVIIVEKKMYEGRDISSTFIREEIQEGNMEKANLLLGYDYFVSGEVMHGRKLGRKLGIPTANLIPVQEKLLPPFGVYVSKIEIDGVIYGGITNIGRKPTIEGENPIGIETHVVDYEGELYGKRINVHFLSFLREEKKFASVDELKEQMKKDIESGKNYLQENKCREEGSVNIT